MDFTTQQIKETIAEINHIKSLWKDNFDLWSDEDKYRFGTADELFEKKARTVDGIAFETVIVPMEVDLLQRGKDEKMEVPFDANSYKLDFPFFQSNGETYLPVIGRNAQFDKINSNIVLNLRSRQKYQPIMICGSHGIGKINLKSKTEGSQIPGLNVEDLFFDFQHYYNNCDIKGLGLAFERLVVASMAVRSYLLGEPVTLEGVRHRG
ncbi:hypothetical protein ROZALSC1DRAFT_30753 [Rozella allomycis CSF55]|uniref:Uncharacterized protein n=1 Tax=Rozella allomycis (strain CSF55) TaxID=988480 RepID=A0A075AXD2_ROZAC|nr:hypothetical protein O9G_001642 [Rozella allomycis CSF55]RKP17437.1 hypothetical protein ROZALSC1DRAFT_30753 [Rozella allomycis CSF55]|eukprot:EPZ34912.1 hypothetical protein O9G_001642 [Rozella allomycis CSF55]